MSNHGTWDQLLNVSSARLAGGDRKVVPLDRLGPNPDQPRKFFAAAALEELTASIRAHGLLQPLLVRPHPLRPGDFQIVAGERRWLAARQADLAEVPVVVRQLDDQTALELGLVENLLREDISPMEEARALQRLLEGGNYSYASLGDRLGKNKAYVDHRVRLLKMPDHVQDALERAEVGDDGRVRRPFTPRHAGVVVQVSDAAAQQALVAEILEEGLSVAEAQRRLRAQVALPNATPAVAPLPVAPEPQRQAPRSAPVAAPPAPPIDSDDATRLDVGTLQTTRLVDAARRNDGQVTLERLLAALDADRALVLQRMSPPAGILPTRDVSRRR